MGNEGLCMQFKMTNDNVNKIKIDLNFLNKNEKSKFKCIHNKHDYTLEFNIKVDG